MASTPRRLCKCGCGKALPRDNTAYFDTEHHKRHRTPTPVACKGCGRPVVAGRHRAYCEPCREVRRAGPGPTAYGPRPERGATVMDPGRDADWKSRALDMGEDEMRRHLGLGDREVLEVLAEQARRTRAACDRQRLLSRTYRPGTGA